MNLSVPWRQATVPRSRRIDLFFGRTTQQYWDLFDATKFEVNNYFAHYRAGYASVPGKLWNLQNAARDPASVLYDTYGTFRRIRGPWTQIYDSIDVQVRGGRRRFRNTPSAGAWRSPRVISMARRIQRLIDKSGFPIRVLKILGNGTYGVALLCDTPSGGRRKRFVLKAELDGQQSMGEEKRHMLVW